MNKLLSLLIIIVFIASCSSINKHIRKAGLLCERVKIDQSIEEYKKALAIDQHNYKANAGLGVMLSEFMNLYEDALPYLETAYNHSPKDTSVDVIFNLAKCYQHHGEFEKALSLYNKLHNAVATEDDNKEFQKDLIKRKQDCEYAIKHKDEKPNQNIFIINVGNNINTKAPEYVPIINNDDLIFTSKRKDFKTEKFNDWDGKYFEAMYISKLTNGKYEPTKLFTIPTQKTKTKYNNNQSILSVSGNQKYLFIFDNGKLTQVTLDSIANSKNKKLSNIINFSYYQNHAYLTKDGKKLFFTSEAKGGMGGLDIYISRKNNDGSWSAPENIGAPINTEYDEESPLLAADEKTLYFASKGHDGFGNYDIYKSTWDGSKWSDPINLGQPINSSGNDIYYTEDASQQNMLFSSSRKGGMGDMDIYKIIDVSKFRNATPSNNINADIAYTKQQDSLYHLFVDIPKSYHRFFTKWTYSNYTDTNTTITAIIPPSKKQKFQYECVLMCDTCLTPIKLVLEKEIENPATIIAANNNTVDINQLPIGKIPNSILSSAGFDTSNIYFDFDKSKIKDEFIAVLNKNIEFLSKYNLSIKILGFADMYGMRWHNLILSQNRANIVNKYMVQHGFPKKKIIVVKGMGTTHYCKSIDDCPDGMHSKNRKATFEVYKTK